MKRLSGISPFILLLIPVFVMALVTMVSPIGENANNKSEMVLKTSASPSITNVFTRITK